MGGWRERVLTEGFEWIDGAAFRQDAVPTLLPGASNLISTAVNASDTIDLGFDPITTGQTLFATKTLRYVGADIAPGDVFHLQISIIANALSVPEPSTLSLLLTGLVLFVPVGRPSVR